MKKQLAILTVIIVLLISACSFNVDVVTPLSVETVSLVTPITPSPVATTPALPEVTEESIFIPNTTEPVFYNAFVSRDPEGSYRESEFPAAIPEIHAFWQYQNMREGSIMRRDWYLNGELWLTREEPWDFAAHGASGTLQGVSIHDFEIGLPSGAYQLIISIDDTVQPIGRTLSTGTESVLEFEVLPIVDFLSPDGQWKASTLYNQLIVTDSAGERFTLFTGLEISALAWLPDSRHILFVDRERLTQESNPARRMQDDLRIADIVNRETSLVYASESRLSDTGGLIVSPDGRYIAMIEGSGYGDACFLDSKVLFIEFAADYLSMRSIRQAEFVGLYSPSDGTMYPTALGIWQSNSQFQISMNGTCGIDPSLMGAYTFDLSTMRTALSGVGAPPLGAGDLGYGEVHGLVTDVATGIAISGATVTCEHSTYLVYGVPCGGAIITSESGAYAFRQVYFHDTDTIKLTVSAPGYQPQEYSQNSFTINSLEVNFSLVPVP